MFFEEIEALKNRAKEPESKYQSRFDEPAGNEADRLHPVESDSAGLFNGARYQVQQTPQNKSHIGLRAEKFALRAIELSGIPTPNIQAATTAFANRLLDTVRYRDWAHTYLLADLVIGLKAIADEGYTTWNDDLTDRFFDKYAPAGKLDLLPDPNRPDPHDLLHRFFKEMDKRDHYLLPLVTKNFGGSWPQTMDALENYGKPADELYMFVRWMTEVAIPLPDKYDRDACDGLMAWRILKAHERADGQTHR